MGGGGDITSMHYWGRYSKQVMNYALLITVADDQRLQVGAM